MAIENDDLLVQTGGYIGVDGKEQTFTELMKAGKIKKSKGSFTAVALVTDAVRAGVTFAYFGFPENPANSVVHRVPDPLTNRYRYKLGKGKLKKIGESPHKHSLTSLSFVPRTL